MEADLIRSGVRLRWVGDGTGRLNLGDMWALVNGFLADETSALFRAMNPDHIPIAQKIAADTLNAVMYVAHVTSSMWSSKKPREFKPLRSYPGSPFDKHTVSRPIVDPASLIGGYRAMSLDEAKEWAKARGLPI